MIEPIWLLKYLPNMLACHICILMDCQGPSNTITEADASSNLAIAEAARIIARGKADVMITGGADSKIHPLSFVRLALQREHVALEGRARAGRAGRSTARRDGMGARRGGGDPDPRGARARPARGAPRFTARCSGAGSGCDAMPGGGLDPEGSGTAIAIAAALEEAGAQPVGDRPRQRPRLGLQGRRPGRGPGLPPRLRRQPAAGDGPQGLHGEPGLRLRRGRADRQPDRRQSRRDSRRSSTATSPTRLCDLDVVRGEPRPTRNPTFVNTNITPNGQAAALVIRGNPSAAGG